MSGRLARGGRLIDRSKRLEFSFNGHPMSGFAGDTLASALLANGRTLVGRSFKYHRPRGIVASGPEEPNALLGLGDGADFEPNQRATTTELTAGMEARSQNHWPSLEFDVGGINSALSKLLTAGFYYKMFIHPRPFWKHVYEPLIRRAAGLGAAPKAPDASRYEHFHAHVDVLVVGGGVAGLMAARSAAARGATVMVIEQTAHWGGRASVDGGVIDGDPPEAWVERTVAELSGMPNARMRVRCMGAGVYDHGYALACETVADHVRTEAPRHRLWKIRARRIIVATGAIERPLVFAGNDLPGVMLASAVRDYAVNWGVSAGDRTVVVANNDDAYRTALTLKDVGMEVAAVIDVRSGAEGPLPVAAREKGIPVHVGRAVAEAKGRGKVERVAVCGTAGDGSALDEIACDVVAMSGGWSPAAHLWSHCGGRLAWDEEAACFRPDAAKPPTGADGKGFVLAAGAANGEGLLASALADGAEAGNAASGDVPGGNNGEVGSTGLAPRRNESAAEYSGATSGGAPGSSGSEYRNDPGGDVRGGEGAEDGNAESGPRDGGGPSGTGAGNAANDVFGGGGGAAGHGGDESRGSLGPPEAEAPEEKAARPIWIMPEGAKRSLREKAWLDYQNDVKVSDVQLAAREGYDAVEHAKRYTTLGMATDQGKLGNVNGLAVLSLASGRSIPRTGTTTFRPPYAPISMGSIAGEARGGTFQPIRRTPMHDWHGANGADWEPVGQWRRPYAYVRPGESVGDAVAREVSGVREKVGILDASTLGKIVVKGEDAGRFLDMLYTNKMSSLKVGRCRYGLMCTENGFLFDDGVVARTGEDEFLCHTTSGGADRVHAHMEEWLQTEWWDWKVWVVNATEQFAQIAVAGPDAGEVLRNLGGMDVSEEALPFMAWADGQLAGIPVRVFRISFSGELSYEIAVKANMGRALWDACLAAGGEFGIAPYGTEALHVLRAEKGFIMIGDETDGTVIPQDLGLDWAVSKKKDDFLGKRAQERPWMRDGSRWRLVGLETVDGSVLPDGAHAVGEGWNANGQRHMIGRVTSTYHSPTLGRGIALGLVERGPERMGETLEFPKVKGGSVKAKIVPPTFFDPEGEKQIVRPERAGRTPPSRKPEGATPGVAVALRGEVYEGLCAVRDLGPVGMVAVRGDLSEGALAEAAAELTGVDFPGPLRCGFSGRAGLAWMSPDELLVIVDYAGAADAVKKLRGALKDKHALVLDMSDARSMISLEGEAARDVLAKLTPADVSPGALPVGAFRRSRLAQAPAGFWMREAGVAEVVVFRSVSRYAFDVLRLAAHPEGSVGHHA